jgi:hypothetical protein
MAFLAIDVSESVNEGSDRPGHFEYLMELSGKFDRAEGVEPLLAIDLCDDF